MSQAQPSGRRIGRKRWRRLLQTLMMKGVTTFYRRLIVVVYPLNGPVRARQPQISVKIQLLTEVDLDVYQAFRVDQNRIEIQARLRRGDRCFCCWYQGKIVDAGWITTRRAYIPYVRRDIVLQPEQVYHYDVYTHPDYRGYGLYAARTAFVGHQTWKEGFSCGLGVVALENKASLTTLVRNGLQPIGQYSCLKLGAWHLTWSTPWSEIRLPSLVKPTL